MPSSEYMIENQYKKLVLTGAFGVFVGLIFSQLLLTIRDNSLPAGEAEWEPLFGFEHGAPLRVTQQSTSAEPASDFENTETFDEQKERIETLKQNIKDLEQELLTLHSQLNQSKELRLLTEKPISMDDIFQHNSEQIDMMIKSSLIEMTEQQFLEFENRFDSKYEMSERDIQYKNSIDRFIKDNNLDEKHYIRSVDCRSELCQIEIITNHEESLQRSLSQMRQQSWYSSVMFATEDKSLEGSWTYYLPFWNP